MLQSMLRIVFALLATAVGASLMIGAVSAEGTGTRTTSGGGWNFDAARNRT